jgi:diguanylate cyclase
VHPIRGLIAPEDFIPLAEECGLIGSIGEWVIGEACRQARAWQDGGVASLRVSVNLSASQFRHIGLVDTVRRALDDASLEPRYLEMELTESAVMSDPELSIAILEQLSTMGVLVSVDDFGTGYSSMSYLRRFPIDKLKIDRVFISEMESCPEDASIVRAIVSLAHSLRLKVVAEGVETPGQLDFLKSVGCDEYQGYHFSRPVARDRVRKPGPRVTSAAWRVCRRRRGNHPQQTRGVPTEVNARTVASSPPLPSPG